MGQQQLLLLVLGIVIVGIAVVAGIQAFSEGKDKAQQDAAISDAMRVVTDVQAWMLKPAAFGGGEGATEKANFRTLGYPTSSLSNSNNTYTTINGCYTLGGTVEEPTLAVYAGVEVNTDGEPTGDCDNKIADVTIEGAGTGDIKWKYDNTTTDN